MTSLTINDSIETVKQSLDQILLKAKRLSEEVIRWNPTEEEWSIMQIFAILWKLSLIGWMKLNFF